MEMSKLIEVMELKKEQEKKPGRKTQPPVLEVPEIPESPKYKLSLTLGDKTYESEGTSVLEALEKIETPAKIFVKGFVKVTHGDKTTERMFFPSQMKRFLYPVARVLVAKALTTTLR